MKINFKIDNDLLVGAKRLAPVLGIEPCCEGMELCAVQGERIGVSLKDGKATVYYRDKVHFFRGLGVLAENAEKSDSFDITEDGFFTTVAAMIDVSRCAALNLPSLKELTDRLALMGYTTAMLYTEDMIELEGYPFFGYMRGRYTHDELREFDTYAFEYGIEIIPCIECYGHMERYLIWPEASAIKDTPNILLAREEKTFAFLDKLIGTVSGIFRSRKIHIGMDEADDMGRGKFLNKHGYVPAFDLFNEYMQDLSRIIDRHGLTPMMWSDMYFRVHSPSKYDYYHRETLIPEETKRCIPENMQMVYWNYGDSPEPDCDEFMLRKHQDLDRGVMMATGAWSWAGHFPEYNYMKKTNKVSLDACRKCNVREAMLTIWCNDNTECPMFANLPALSYFAESCYDLAPTDRKLADRFAATADGALADFIKLTYYHNDFERGRDFSDRNKRFFGKSLFWQDVLEGIYDCELAKHPMSEHFAFAKEDIKSGKNGRWIDLFDFAEAVFDYQYTKTYIAERLYPAYKEGDKTTLQQINSKLLPELMEKCRKVHALHKQLWFKYNKAFGWQNMDVKYAGTVARCETATWLLSDYLSGKTDRIEELEIPRLPLVYHPYITYQRSFTVNYK